MYSFAILNWQVSLGQISDTLALGGFLFSSTVFLATPLTAVYYQIPVKFLNWRYSGLKVADRASWRV